MPRSVSVVLAVLCALATRPAVGQEEEARPPVTVLHCGTLLAVPGQPPQAEATVVVEGAEGVSARVDPLLVRQALLNLLDNAVKYGPEGQTVRMGWSEGLAGVRLWVEDEGMGVAPADRSRIWEAYYRLPRHRESSVAGSGIGLSVVWEVAEAHGGAVRVVEARSGGARFELELPPEP